MNTCLLVSSIFQNGAQSISMVALPLRCGNKLRVQHSGVLVLVEAAYHVDNQRIRQKDGLYSIY